MTTQWLIVAGSDGYNTKIVEGWNHMERAVIEMIFGDAEPGSVHDEEVQSWLAFLRADDNWHQDNRINTRTRLDFEDGYVEVLRLVPPTGAQ